MNLEGAAVYQFDCDERILLGPASALDSCDAKARSDSRGSQTLGSVASVSKRTQSTRNTTREAAHTISEVYEQDLVVVSLEKNPLS